VTADQRRWAQRRAAGLCGDCGVVPTTRFSRCTLCRQFLNEKRRAWWKRGGGQHVNRLKREAYAKNPEPFRARAKAFQGANRETECARHRAYYAAHRNEMKAKEKARYWAKKQALQANQNVLVSTQPQLTATL
jgi:hypothetical protein